MRLLDLISADPVAIGGDGPTIAYAWDEVPGELTPRMRDVLAVAAVAVAPSNGSAEALARAGTGTPITIVPPPFPEAGPRAANLLDVMVVGQRGGKTWDRMAAAIVRRFKPRVGFDDATAARVHGAPCTADKACCARLAFAPAHGSGRHGALATGARAAMACGCALVVETFPGWRGILSHDETAIIVTADRAIDAITGILASRGKLASLGMGGASAAAAWRRWEWEASVWAEVQARFPSLTS